MTPAWSRRAYLRRHPLTQHFARTLDEIDEAKYRSAWEGPESGELHRFRLAEALRWLAAIALLLSLFYAPQLWRAIAA